MAITHEESGTVKLENGKLATAVVTLDAAGGVASGSGGGGGDASAANQTTLNTLTGAVTETAPATDTASSGLNGRLQRVAQRLTSLVALLPAALGAGGGLKVDGSGTALPVSGTVTVNALPAGTNNIGDVDVLSSALPTGAATEATLAAASAKLPAALGQLASSASLAMVLSTEQEAILEAKFEAGQSVAPQQIVATTGTVTRVASSATSGQLLAANTSRVSVIIHNNSTADAYIKYGTTVDIAGGDESYTYPIPAGSVWTMPDPPYTGRIDIIWESANGFAVVTEET